MSPRAALALMLTCERSWMYPLPLPRAAPRGATYKSPSRRNHAATGSWASAGVWRISAEKPAAGSKKPVLRPVYGWQNPR